jgi:hypothetical protein
MRAVGERVLECTSDRRHTAGFHSVVGWTPILAVFLASQDGVFCVRQLGRLLRAVLPEAAPRARSIFYESLFTYR